LLALGGAIAIGCGGQPPKELVDARQAYARAQAGPAAQRAPAKLEESKTALKAAEKANSARADVPNPKTLAYVAERKAQTAEAMATESVAQDRQREAEQQIQRMSASAAQQAQPSLPTGPGEAHVFFDTGKSDLSRPEQAELDGIVIAMRNHPDAVIVVEGHTDSRGSTMHNQKLSMERATAVKEYLVSQGVDSSRIVSRGAGETDPAASNDSAEGRASNRRVTIMIEARPRETP
jgi:outer membrane protein OmpA-like peptidoglycan-associated protein